MRVAKCIYPVNKFISYVEKTSSTAHGYSSQLFILLAAASMQDVVGRSAIVARDRVDGLLFMSHFNHSTNSIRHLDQEWRCHGRKWDFSFSIFKQLGQKSVYVHAWGRKTARRGLKVAS